MRYLLYFVVLFLSTQAAGHNKEPKPTEEDYRTAESFTISRMELRHRLRVASRNTPVEAIKSEVYNDFLAAKYAPHIDKTVEAIINRTARTLRAKGFEKEANDIELEFYSKFDGFVEKTFFLMGDIGDYAPWSEFLAHVHELAHDRVGEVLCKFLHIHDLFIITYGVPVVFSPSGYDLETYQNHFTGIHVLGPLWEHYGLAPVVVYWAVVITCDVATSGMGAAVFACGIVGSLAEDAFGIYLSPQLGEACWKAGQADKI